VITRLDDPTTTADDAPVDEADIEEAGTAGPLTLAIDMSGDGADSEAPAAAVPAV
jgi:exoribonuclease-2